jgi:hypothetical protein
VSEREEELIKIGDTTYTLRDDGWWESYAENEQGTFCGEDPKLTAMLSLAEEHIDALGRIEALLSRERFPTKEQTDAALRRISKRDAEIIDKAFDEGATLLVNAKWDMRKKDREIERLRTALANAQRENDAMAAVVEQACRWDNASTTGDDYHEHDALVERIRAYRARAQEGK